MADIALSRCCADTAYVILAVRERPYLWCLLAFKVAAGAVALTYPLSFFNYHWAPLLAMLAVGSGFGPACWPLVWRAVQRLTPDALVPYLAIWARDGLVAGKQL